MSTSKLLSTVKSIAGDSRSKAHLLQAHGNDLARTGIQILRAAKDVLSESGQQGVRLVIHTRSELLRTLSEGRDQILYKLSNIAIPTHKERAEARKSEIKEEKKSKRIEQQGQADASRS